MTTVLEELDDLVDSLPSDIVPNVTTGHVGHSVTYRELLRLLSNGAGGGVVSPNNYGADNTGATNSQDAFEDAIDKIVAGTKFVLLPGTYLVDTAWFENLEGFEIVTSGAWLVGAEPSESVLRMIGCGEFSVSGLRLKQDDISGGRNSTGFGARLQNCEDFDLNVKVRDVTAGGVIFYTCSDGRISGKVKDSLADGFHATHGCRRLHHSGCMVEGSGDDAFAIVAYQSHGTYSQSVSKDISYSGCHTFQTKGRGYAVLGGEGVTVEGGTVREPKYAGLYCAFDAFYDTYGSKDVTFDGVKVYEPNTFDSPGTNYAGIDFRPGNPGFPVDNIKALNCTVRGGGWRMLNVGGPTGSDLSNVHIRGCDFFGPTDTDQIGAIAANVRNFWLEDSYVAEANDYGVWVETTVTGVVHINRNTVENANSSNLSNRDAFNIRADGAMVHDNEVIDGNGFLQRAFEVTLPATIDFFGNKWNGEAVLISPEAGTLIRTLAFLEGAGSPEGVVTALVGSIYSRSDGGAGTSLYVKESGSGNTGWVAK